MPLRAVAAIALCLIPSLFADEPQLKLRPTLPPNGAAGFRVPPGQRIPVRFLNTVSTRTAAAGDRVYLQTVFPIVLAGRIVIPVGSYIDAEVSQVRRAGRVKGRAELYVQLSQLTLPNGVQRPLHGDIGNIGADNTSVSRTNEGAVEGASKRLPSCPTGIIVSALTMRGPEVVLSSGTTAEIVLQDEIRFSPTEIAPSQH